MSGKYSFVFDESDVQRFRSICDRIGIVQAKFFKRLLDRYEQFDELDEKYQNLRVQYKLLLKKHERCST